MKQQPLCRSRLAQGLRGIVHNPGLPTSDSFKPLRLLWRVPPPDRRANTKNLRAERRAVALQAPPDEFGSLEARVSPVDRVDLSARLLARRREMPPREPNATLAEQTAKKPRPPKCNTARVAQARRPPSPAPRAAAAPARAARESAQEQTLRPPRITRTNTCATLNVLPNPATPDRVGFRRASKAKTQAEKQTNQRAETAQLRPEAQRCCERFSRGRLAPRAGLDPSRSDKTTPWAKEKKSLAFTAAVCWRAARRPRREPKLDASRRPAPRPRPDRLSVYALTAAT